MTSERRDVSALLSNGMTNGAVRYDVAFVQDSIKHHHRPPVSSDSTPDTYGKYILKACRIGSKLNGLIKTKIKSTSMR